MLKKPKKRPLFGPRPSRQSHQTPAYKITVALEHFPGAPQASPASEPHYGTQGRAPHGARQSGPIKGFLKLPEGTPGPLAIGHPGVPTATPPGPPEAPVEKELLPQKPQEPGQPSPEAIAQLPPATASATPQPPRPLVPRPFKNALRYSFPKGSGEVVSH